MTTDIDDILGVQQSPQREARNKQSSIPLQGTPPPFYVRRPTRRAFINALRVKSAAEALTGLPAEGETWHGIMTGDYDSFDLVPTMLDHARPAVIDALHLATLGFNQANTHSLLKLMDTGKVRRCTMIVSLFYEADRREADICYTLARELPVRGVGGGWYCAARSHAKVIAARFSDGRCFVIESSANLRTCRNLEQFAITHDAGLFDFHRQWMESVYEHENRRASRD